MQIDELMYSPGPTPWYTDELRQHFDDQVPLLRVAQSTQIAPVDPILRFRRQGDLYGLFRDLGVNEKMFYITMRVNGLNDPMVIPDTLEYLMVPDEAFLNQIMYAVSSTKRLN